MMRIIFLNRSVYIVFVVLLVLSFTVTDCYSGHYCCDCGGLCYSFDADDLSEADQKCVEQFFGMTCMMPLYEGNYVCSYKGPFVGEMCSIGSIPDNCLLERIYGEHSEETELLRNFRDHILTQTPEGQEIIRLYYEWSPAIVKVMEEDAEFKEEVKGIIDGVLKLIGVTE